MLKNLISNKSNLVEPSSEPNFPVPFHSTL